MKTHNETKIDSKELFNGKVFRVTIDTVELENENQTIREVVHHNGGAGVLAINDKGQIAMVRQFRYAAGKEMLEIPAGKIEEGEPPRQTAIRELAEEAGLEAEEFIDFGDILPTCAYCTETIYLYLARQLKSVPQKLDDDEFLSVFWMDLEEALTKIISGEINDSKTVVAILKYDYLLRNYKI